MFAPRLLIPAALVAATAFAQEAPTAQQVLDRSVEAMGGRAAIEKHTTVSRRGTFELPDMGASGTVEILAKAPDKMVTNLVVDGYGTVHTGFDGKVGYTVRPEGETILSGQALTEIQRDATFNKDLKLAELYKSITVKGQETVNGVATWAVVFTADGSKPEMVYYDAKTWLPVRAVVKRSSDEGETEIVTDVSDWKEVSGVKMAHKIRQKVAVGTLVFTLSEVAFDVPLADSLFAK